MHDIVRVVLHNEYYKYRTHLKQLDTASRALRFGHAVTDEIIDRLCDGFDAAKQHHMLFCIENSDLEFVAVGHVAIENEMELALSVLKQHQGQGMGSALITRCIQWCRTHGILKGHMMCLSYNTTIRHLCRKHGIKMKTEHGETLAQIELDHPSLETYVREGFSTNMAVFDYMQKRANDIWQ